MEVSGSKSVANCGQSTYKSSMCFGNSFHFHEDVENPIRLCAQGGGSCFESSPPGMGFSFSCHLGRPVLTSKTKSCGQASRNSNKAMKDEVGVCNLPSNFSPAIYGERISALR